MNETIGRLLGSMLALFEKELLDNPDDMEMLDRIQKISEIYKNLSAAEFGEFRADFENGYHSGKATTDLDHETAAEVHERVFGYDPTPD